MASLFGAFSQAHLLLLLFMASICLIPTSSHAVDVSAAMKPVGTPVLSAMVFNETRRRLGSFQICALCTCCGGPKGLCLPSPCCYAINCNIPNRPFGFCSFTPKTCNCFGCHL